MARIALRDRQGNAVAPGGPGAVVATATPRVLSPNDDGEVLAPGDYRTQSTGDFTCELAWEAGGVWTINDLGGAADFDVRFGKPNDKFFLLQSGELTPIIEAAPHEGTFGLGIDLVNVEITGASTENEFLVEINANVGDSTSAPQQSESLELHSTCFAITPADPALTAPNVFDWNTSQVNDIRATAFYITQDRSSSTPLTELVVPLGKTIEFIIVGPLYSSDTFFGNIGGVRLNATNTDGILSFERIEQRFTPAVATWPNTTYYDLNQSNTNVGEFRQASADFLFTDIPVDLSQLASDFKQLQDSLTSSGVMPALENTISEVSNGAGANTGSVSTTFVPTETRDYVFEYSGEVQQGTGGISVGTTVLGADLFVANPASGDADGSRLTLTRQENFTPPIPLTAGVTYHITQWAGGGGIIFNHTVSVQEQPPSGEQIADALDTTGFESVRDAILGNYGRGTPTSGTSAPNGQQRSVPLANVVVGGGDITYDSANHGFVIPTGTVVEITGITRSASASQNDIRFINSPTSLSNIPGLVEVTTDSVSIFQGIYVNDTGSDVIIGIGVSGGGNTGNSNPTGYLMVRKIN